MKFRCTPKPLWVAATLLLVLVPGAAGADGTVEPVKLDMFVGQVHVLRDVRVETVAIGNGKLIKVKTMPRNQILIIAEKPGSTSLHLWHKDGTESAYNIRITESDPELRVRREKMIHMDVRIVEFRKQALRKLGINWAKQADGPGFALAGDFQSSTLFRGSSGNQIFKDLPLNVRPFQAWFGIATEITSRINYLATTGDAVTLAEPKLSCRNGGVAKFLAGGEVPYPVTTSLGQTNVEFKEYGIRLNISPVADPTGFIAAKILAEVSQIDPSVTVRDVPGLITRRTETEMNVREGETIVISGLLNGETSRDVDKIPGLGDIPILGWLFKSENFRNQLTELVIFVTPRISDPASPVDAARLRAARARRDARLKEMQQVLQFELLE